MIVNRLPLGHNDTWRREALCAQVDPELWFPEHGSSEESRAAKKICSQCPVQIPCLQYALDAGEDYGLWGGQNISTYRARIRRRAS